MHVFLAFLAVLITLCASYEDQRRPVSGPAIRNVYHRRNAGQFQEGIEKRDPGIRSSLLNADHKAFAAQILPPPDCGDPQYPERC
jgi:hypothetical protein